LTAVERQSAERGDAATVRRLGSVPALDGLRGIAVLLVVVNHTWIVLPGQTGLTAVDNFFRGGFLGVDLFFVLSGFLITALLLREQADHRRVRFGSFYARRALRLLPALFVLLGAHAIYAAYANPPFPFEHEVLNIRAAVFYYANWFVVFDLLRAVPDLGHLWSLSVEEQFYLIWPTLLVLFFGLRRRIAPVVMILVAGIVAVAVHRAMMWDGSNWLPLFNRTDTRADSLLVGALLACLWVRCRTPEKGLVPAAWVASGILILCVEFARGNQAFLFLGGFTLVAVAASVLILATLESDWPGNRFLSIAPLRAVGRVSYGLYLWHVVVFWAVSRWGSTWPDQVRMLVALGGAAACTLLSWVLVEQPALRLKRRFEYRSPSSQADSATLEGSVGTSSGAPASSRPDQAPILEPGRRRPVA
jgi:peptidoglycan/LPS O-acetylase OafA/YrhL